MQIEEAIKRLVAYAFEQKLIEESDKDYCTNRLLEILYISDYKEPEEEFQNAELEPALKALTDWAVSKRLTVDEGITARDLFDTKIMGVFADRPSNIIAKFNSLYRSDPISATDWFYKFSGDIHYIRRERIAKDLKWQTPTPYGDLDITVNLSKPEKDPKAIAAAKNAPQSSYPKCPLCKENVGYAGRLNHPARQNLRTIPLTLGGSAMMMQYSPYVYYNEHCIVFNEQHIPMSITKETFGKLLDFVSLLPHYFLGSNADLPIVGGSILSHDHFQGGRYVFPMEKAPIDRSFVFRNFEDVEAGIVIGPCPASVCAMRIKNGLRALGEGFLMGGETTAIPNALSLPFREASLTTPSPPSPGIKTENTNWTWCCATISPRKSTPSGCFIHTKNCITSKRKTSG